jgi:hypothetical protein
MDAATFDDLQRTLAAEGADAAIDRLCRRLRDEQDYHGLFYARLLKKRHELGVSPVPTGPAQDLPEAVHRPYEEAIRDAAREAGRLFIEAGNLPQAWAYFRMLGEPEPMRQALEAHIVAENEDVHALVQIAFYEGVHPRRGFAWVLERFGLCSAITTLGGSGNLPLPADVRADCVKSLVRALYAELRQRLAVDIERTEGRRPDGAEDEAGAVRRLMAGRDWLFGEDCYHVDTSHLSSVVQMSLQLGPGPELELARELCDYGARLSGRFLGQHEPPFEDFYRAHGHYLAALAGEGPDEAVAYFRSQLDSHDSQEVGTYPAEVLVNLLVRLGRPAEALAVARRHLAGLDAQQLSCPGVAELCRQANDYQALAEAAREQGDAVHFLAGLLAAGR